MVSTLTELKKPSLIKDMDSWRAYLTENWQSQELSTKQLKFENHYHFLVAMSFSPVLPNNKEALKRLIAMLQKLRFAHL